MLNQFPKKTRKYTLIVVTLFLMALTFVFVFERNSNFRLQLIPKVAVAKTVHHPALQSLSYGPIMIDLEGKELTQAEQKILTHPKVGGVLLFNKNFESKRQIKNLVESIRTIRKNIIIAVDQEGGHIQRFRGKGFKALPSARVYGDLYNLNPKVALELAYKYGKQAAKDLVDCDIDLNLGPVIDLYGNNPEVGGLDRAFHSDPNVVFELSKAYINGMQRIGMPAAGKHFPGLGFCEENPSNTLPVCYESYHKLMDKDLLPFKKLIYLDKLDAIVASSLIYPVVDQNNSVSTSKIWLQNMLRDELGFKGVIISHYIPPKNSKVIEDPKIRILQALNAGTDLVILSNINRKELLQVLNTLNWQSVKESEIRLASLRSKNS